MANIQYAGLRFWSILKKEFIMIIRDIRTYIFLIIIPFSEVVLFGYIINTDAKHLPTVIISNDQSPFTNSIINGFQNTGYFNIKKITRNNVDSEQLLKSHQYQFVISIPHQFTRDLLRSNQPHILVEGDATDPIAVGNAFHAAESLPNYALTRESQGVLDYLAVNNTSFSVDTHAVFNPGVVAQFHTLPGLIMSILTVSLVMLTAISITSEFEQGTMEVLLITPVKPLDIIIGKMIPNVILGYILLSLTLLVSHYLFNVPFRGSILMYYIAALFFIISSLSVGISASSVSKSQFQAANTANTYTLPAILFSGFLFPYHGMPVWAQWLGSLLPTTHFFQLTTNIMIKNAAWTEVWHDLWPIIIFMIVVNIFSYKYYRNTLD
jgi:ABC-2 type transport system permease protein